MPLFIGISGYLFNYNFLKSSPKDFIKKLFKKIIVPLKKSIELLYMFIFSFILISLYFLLFLLKKMYLMILIEQKLVLYTLL